MNAVMIPAFAILLVQTPPSLRTDERRPFNRITRCELKQDLREMCKQRFMNTSMFEIWFQHRDSLSIAI